MTLSMQPYRGTKDYHPDRQKVRQFIFDKWRKLAALYGYEEYSGPFLEPIELYLSKTSEEVVNEQLYTLIDKGDRKLAIRPEMTPTLARMVASCRDKFVDPIRWFCIESCMRYERPQRGRLRQFDQFNLDFLGGDVAIADMEVLDSIITFMRSLNASLDDFRIRINHRGLLNSFLAEDLKLSPETALKTIRVLDALDKMPKDVFEAKLAELGLSAADIERLNTLVHQDLEHIAGTVGPKAQEYVVQIKSLIDGLNKIWGAAVCVFDVGVIRGFDYYTGMIFEVRDNHPDNRRALFGGGRYDNLMELFEVTPLSGIGYGVSETSIYNFLETHQLLPDLKKQVDVVIGAVFDRKGEEIVASFAKDLRMAGVPCQIFPSVANSPTKIIKFAERTNARICIFVGGKEAESKMLAAKDIGKREEFLVDLNSAASLAIENIQKRLRG